MALFTTPTDVTSESEKVEINLIFQVDFHSMQSTGNPIQLATYAGNPLELAFHAGKLVRVDSSNNFTYECRPIQFK